MYSVWVLNGKKFQIKKLIKLIKNPACWRPLLCLGPQASNGSTNGICQRVPSPKWRAVSIAWMLSSCPTPLLSTPPSTSAHSFVVFPYQPHSITPYNREVALQATANGRMSLLGGWAGSTSRVWFDWRPLRGVSDRWRSLACDKHWARDEAWPMCEGPGGVCVCVRRALAVS